MFDPPLRENIRKGANIEESVLEYEVGTEEFKDEHVFVD